MPISKNNKVKALHMAIGCDLIGSRTSVGHGPTHDVIQCDGYFSIWSKKANREIRVPFANTKAWEMMPDERSETFDQLVEGEMKFNPSLKKEPKKKAQA